MRVWEIVLLRVRVVWGGVVFRARAGVGADRVSSPGQAVARARARARAGGPHRERDVWGVGLQMVRVGVIEWGAVDDRRVRVVVKYDRQLCLPLLGVFQTPPDLLE